MSVYDNETTNEKHLYSDNHSILFQRQTLDISVNFCTVGMTTMKPWSFA